MARRGTSRTTRDSAALQPGWLQIDGRTLRRLLADTPRLAALFRYYDETNQPDGHWDAFFKGEPLVQYAMLAESDVDAQRQLFQTELKGLGKNSLPIDPADIGDQAGAWSVIQRLLLLYLRIDHVSRFFAALPRETEYAGMLRQAITGPLRDDLRGVLDCRAWLRANPRPPFEQPGWPGALLDREVAALAVAWQLPAGDVLDGSDLTPGRFVNQLSTATWSTQATFVQLVEAAGTWYEQRVSNPIAQQPHFALYLAFLRQFGRQQAAMNQIPQRHCDYFYREILKLRPAPPVPDKVFVSFTAAPNTGLALPVSTLLSAGKDADGLAVTYSTQNEIVVTSAQVARFSTVFLKPPVGKASGFYVALQANSADGEGAALPPGASWATFGEDQAGLSTAARTMADAEVGFAITSPVLHLESGTRKIEVVVGYAGSHEPLQSRPSPPALLPAVPGVVEYSGSSGWVVVPAAQTTCALQYGSKSGDIAPLNVTFVVTLAAGDPACVNYDPKTLGPGYDSRVPALRIRYPNPLTAFPTTDVAVRNVFLTAPVASVAVRVDVTEMAPTVLFGPTGALAPAKPAPILGAPVQPAAQFLLGAVELFRKRLLTLSTSLDWIGLPTDAAGLRGYFEPYLIAFKNPPRRTFRNDQYLVQWAALFDCAWSPINTAPGLPQDQPDGRYLFRWKILDGAKDLGNGRLYTSRTWTIDLVALQAWRADPSFAGPLVPGPTASTGFFRLTLAAPDYLFGQPIYAAVVSQIALDNALAIAAATKPAPAPPSPSSYTLQAAYDILVEAPGVWTFLGNWLSGSPPAAKLKAEVSPVVKAAGMLPPEVKAFVVAADRLPDETYDDVVKMVDALPSFSPDPTSFAAAVGAFLKMPDPTFPWVILAPALEAARDEIIGWMASLLDKAAPPPQPILKPQPPPPLVPTATNVRLSYTAEAKLDLASGASDSPSWDRLWQIAPFATYPLQKDAALLPQVGIGGTLFLGIVGAELPQTISLLFNLEDRPVTDIPNTLADRLQWSCLVKDKWVPAGKAIHLGFDGFLQTGIVHIDLGGELDVSHTTMPSGFIWVRVEVSKPAEHLRTIQVLPNAIQAAWVVPQDISPSQVMAHFAAPLPAGRIASLVTPMEGIAAVVQPLPSSGGAPTETDRQFAARVSERLRHKGRAVACCDYERILLQAFPSVFYARAATRVVPGGLPYVEVMVLPTLKSAPRAVPPGFTPMEIAEMRTALLQVAPLSASITVINPAYFYVKVKTAVVFNTDRSFDYYKKQLITDLAGFISPWIYDQVHVTDPVRSFHLSELSTFIHTRTYVQEAGPCSVSLQQAGTAGWKKASSDIIAPPNPSSLLIAEATQDITQK